MNLLHWKTQFRLCSCQLKKEQVVRRQIPSEAQYIDEHALTSVCFIVFQGRVWTPLAAALASQGKNVGGGSLLFVWLVVLVCGSVKCACGLGAWPTPPGSTAGGVGGATEAEPQSHSRQSSSKCL